MTVSFKQGLISYEDSKDHFENGLLRLLNIDISLFNSWLKYANIASGSLLERLTIGFAQIRPIAASSLNEAPIVAPGPYGENGNVWHEKIAENNDYGVAKSIDNSIAWLIKTNNNVFIRESTPPIYEEEYFEYPSGGGYSQYEAEADWRFSKAVRQLKDINVITGITSGKALDIGSGYGYFRAALQKQFEHYGIEISKHACEKAKYIFGHNTFCGTIEMYSKYLESKYDLITLWDVIEHIADPTTFFNNIAYCLKPGGFLVIKTPNIDCIEADVFGANYHSLKREHLVYFSKSSLTKIAGMANLSPHFITTTSHLLTGFFGKEQTDKWATECKGADLIAYFKKI